MEHIKIFIATFIFCICLDLIWLAVIAKNLYDNQIGSLLRKSQETLSPQWGGVLMVYIAITLGIILFVLPKTQNHYSMAVLYGGLFGLVTYSIYDFTNYSILAKWPLAISVIDIGWGTFLCGATSCFCLMIKKWIES
jgi:uncharacterized membrane protein